jgi:hypothetical protein
MPLKIKLKVGEDTFEVEGDQMDPSLVELAKAWTAALPPADPDNQDADTAAEIREVTGDVRDRRESLGGVVPASNPDTD